MPLSEQRDFPLFPLGIVVLPTESVPLHIFEDRYRSMIEHCLDVEPGSPTREFGILWLSDEELEEVGCACEIERVVERLPDGRMNIVVRGTRPFHMLERQDDLPYPAGVVRFLDDIEGSSGPDAGAQARELYRDLVMAATDRELQDAELAELDSYDMAGTVEFDLEAKQRLLELRSEDERLGLLAGLLRAAIERLDLIERAQARARSNGKVRFG